MAKTPLQLNNSATNGEMGHVKEFAGPRAHRKERKSLPRQQRLEKPQAGLAQRLLSPQAESPLLDGEETPQPAPSSSDNQPKTNRRISRLHSTALQWPKRSGKPTNTDGTSESRSKARNSGPPTRLSRVLSWGNRSSTASGVGDAPSSPCPLTCQSSGSYIGSLHRATNETHLPLLSKRTKMRLQALDASAKQRQLEVTVERSDELPFGAYSRPQVRVHIVDRCTGRALYPAQMTNEAKFCTASDKNGSSSNAFEWQQALGLSVDMMAFLSPRTALLFEILERKIPVKGTRFRQGKWFESVNKRDPDEGTGYQETPESFPTAESASATEFRRIAWGFFHTITNKGDPTMNSFVLPHVPDETKQKLKPLRQRPIADVCGLRVRLFEYQMLTWMDHYQAKVQWGWRKNHPTVPTVFLQYQKRSRISAPSTLHVELRAVLPRPADAPAIATVGIEHAVTSDSDHRGNGLKTGLEERTVNNQESPTSPSKNKGNLLLPDTTPSDPFDLFALCKRNLSEPCLVPQRVLCSLPTGKKGCSAVSFSPCGRYLAASVSPGLGEFIVRVHHVSTGDLFAIGRGHRSVVYSLEWDARPNRQLRLLSASSDGTVRLWELPSESTRTAGSGFDLPSPSTLSAPSHCLHLQVLFQWHHFPCFVYCAVFLPGSNGDIVLTGASDGCLRFRQEAPVPSGQPEYGTIQVSAAALHSICVEAKTGRIFCGDAKGDITVWSRTLEPTSNAFVSSGYELIKTIRTGQSSITSLQLHPRKAHLLVHTQPNAIFQYELRSYLLLNKSYAGVASESLLVKSTFSPDGKLVISGSEDGVPRLFTSLHGQQLQRGVWGTRLFHECPVLDVSWSPTAHMAALCSYGGSHPIVVLCAYRDDQEAALVEDLTAESQRPASQFPVGAVRALEDANQQQQMASEEHVQRVQRALERRRQRLQSKLALEIDANSKKTSSTAV